MDSQRGTLGVRVTLAGGRPGYVTAGHAAPTIGAVVTIDGQPVGTVLTSTSREKAPSREPIADIAVIAPSDGVAGIEVLDGLGHWWMVQDPQRGATALQRFWSSLKEP